MLPFSVSSMLRFFLLFGECMPLFDAFRTTALVCISSTKNYTIWYTQNASVIFNRYIDEIIENFDIQVLKYLCVKWLRIIICTFGIGPKV